MTVSRLRRIGAGSTCRARLRGRFFDVGPRQWMQDVDRIADIQAISRPARHCRPRVQVEPLSVVRRAQRGDGIARHRGERRNVRQWPAVRSPEAELSISLSLHLITLFVHRAMMATTQQREIRQRGGASVGPMAKVMALTECSCAAGEAAAPVPVL